MPPVREKSEIGRIQKLVQQKLNAKRPLTAKQLNVVDFVLDPDGWLHFVVCPTQAGVRAYDYATALAEVELELRDDGIDRVLLVPAMPDFSPTARQPLSKAGGVSSARVKRISPKRAPASGKNK